MSTVWPMWLWAILLPAFTFGSQCMCISPAPRSLGGVALALLYFSAFTLFVFLAAVPAAIYFGATSILFRNTDGELVRRASMTLSCLCFIGLWLLAIWSAGSLRHRAFVRASRVGHNVIRALAQYQSDTGEYPDTLERLVPDYLEQIPYTEMIGYPKFSYFKDRNDIQANPGSYELRIECTSGMLNFDRFIFWPSERYPERIQDNPVERIDKWAYVHE